MSISIQRGTQKNNDGIPLMRSSMPPYEDFIEAIKPLWDSHWLTNMGCYHEELEEKLAEYLEVPRISLMVNGHMALEMTLQAFDFPKGSEVITTPFTFISTTHAIVRNGLNPVFCDVLEEDGTLDPQGIEELVTEKTVAILPVHVYGNICRVEQIERIAKKYDLKVIYDAAHAFGVKYKNRGVGSYGDASIFSFHATKLFHTIEGGAVVCKTNELYEKLYNLKNFGIRDEEMVVSVGANAKMNEFSAIMGLCNLKRLDTIIQIRREHVNRYRSELYDRKKIRFLFSPENSSDGEQDTESSRMNYSYCPVLIEKGAACSRDDLSEYLMDLNIHTRKYFYPLTADQACFKNHYQNVSLPIARKLAKQVLVLPIYEELNELQQERVIRAIRERI